MNSTATKNLALSALFLTLALLLPFLTGQIPSIGSALLPMHIPVLVAGYVCGYRHAAVVGLIAPVLRSLIFTMPKLFPTAVAMSFELATYGLLIGIMYAAFSGYIGEKSFILLKINKLFNRIFSVNINRYIATYISLIVAMIGGRVVWGFVSLILLGVDGGEFTIAIFFQGAFLGAIPGILLQLILIPTLILGLERAKVIKHA